MTMFQLVIVAVLTLVVGITHGQSVTVIVSTESTVVVKLLVEKTPEVMTVSNDVTVT